MFFKVEKIFGSFKRTHKRMSATQTEQPLLTPKRRPKKGGHAKVDHVLAIDLGSFCDNKIMEHALDRVRRRFRVVYLTDSKHKLPANEYVRETFDTPSFFVSDPVLEAADPQSSFLLWTLKHPAHAIQAFRWCVDVHRKLEALVAKYNPKVVLVLYPALSVVWLFQTSAPIYVLYSAPGLVTYSLPWLFSSSLKDPFASSADCAQMYRKKQENVQSGLTYLQRISGYTSRIFARTDGKQPLDVYRSLHHVLCWDPAVLPKLDFPRRYIRNVTQAGTLLSRQDARKKPLPMDVSRVVRATRRRPLIFVSFGTYGTVEELREPLKLLLVALEEFCKARDGVVLYHNGGVMSKFIDQKQLSHVRVFDGFVQYESLVPHVDLVIFTGSCCLQNICLQNGKPMMFLPLLNEQFYWAKNYMCRTGVPYVDFRSYFQLRDARTFAAVLEKAMSDAARTYAQAVSKSIRSRQPASEVILDLVVAADAGSDA